MATDGPARRRPHTILVRAALVVGAICLAVPAGNVLASSVVVVPGNQPFSTVGSAPPSTQVVKPSTAPSPSASEVTPQVVAPPVAVDSAAAPPPAAVPSQGATAEPTPSPSSSVESTADSTVTAEPTPTPSPSDSPPRLDWQPCVLPPDTPLEMSLSCGQEFSVVMGTPVSPESAPSLDVTTTQQSLEGKFVVIGWAADTQEPTEVGRSVIDSAGRATVVLPSASNITSGHWTLAVL